MRALVAAWAFAIAPSGAGAPPPATGVEWQHDWKGACAEAARAKKPLLIVIMKDAEPACPRMMRLLTGDAEVAAKLADFVLVPCCVTSHAPEGSDPAAQKCPLFAGTTCAEHLAIEKELHPRFADAVSGDIIVPQHVVCDSAGTVLLRHPWEMKRPALLEFLQNGLELFRGPAAGAKGPRSPAVQKLLDSILAVKSDESREEATRNLLSDASPEREAAFLEAVAHLKAPADKRVVIRAAGHPELKAFSKTVAKLLDEKDALLRDCAVVTLEEQRDPSVAPALLALWEREKDAEIRKDVVRALGPCGGGRPDVKKLLLGELADAKEPLRAAAACSLGSFLKGDDEVAAALEAKWAKERSAGVQVGLLWGIGESEDPAQAAFVDRLLKKQRSNDLEKLSVLVKTRLEVGLDKMTFGHGKGHRAEIHHLLAPLVGEDRIERNYVADLDRTNLKK